MRLQLLQTKRDSFLILIKVKYNNIQFLIQLKHLIWMVDTSPGNICYIKKSVNTTQVHESSKVSDILNDTFKNLPFLKTSNNRFSLISKIAFDKSFVRYDGIFDNLVDLHNFEFHCLAYV